MRRSRRFEAIDEQPVNQDSILEEWAEGGFVMMDGPNDPDPSVTVEDGRIIEMDGTERE